MSANLFYVKTFQVACVPSDLKFQSKGELVLKCDREGEDTN
jgi:hypothetical protein